MGGRDRIPGVGLRDLKKRWTADTEDLHKESLQKKFGGNDTTRLCDVELRQKVKVAGEIKRIRTVPRSGIPALEIVVTDGTADATIVFTGRRSVGGLEHGRGVVVEGVAHNERGKCVILNPAYTLLPHV
jgi:RecG-like helicase